RPGGDRDQRHQAAGFVPARLAGRLLRAAEATAAAGGAGRVDLPLRVRRDDPQRQKEAGPLRRGDRPDEPFDPLVRFTDGAMTDPHDSVSAGDEVPPGFRDELVRLYGAPV